MKYDSIIFDLDGTLWNSAGAIVDTWNRVAEKHIGISKPLKLEDIEGIMGLQVKEIGQKLFPQLSEEQQLALVIECCEVECEDLKQRGGELYEGLEEVLRKLSKDHKLFIVSNCQEGYIEAFYYYHKLGKYFVDYEYSGRTKLPKGENIKLVMERNGLKNPIYIGDTAGDLKGARVAGIPFAYAAYGFGNVEEYDYKINCLADIIGLAQI